MAGDITLTIEGKKYDLDDFELGELEWLEGYIDAPLMEEGRLFSLKTMVGFVYLVKKRENPAFTIEEARKIKLSVLGSDEEDADNGKPAKRRPTKPATSGTQG